MKQEAYERAKEARSKIRSLEWRIAEAEVPSGSLITPYLVEVCKAHGATKILEALKFAIAEDARNQINRLEKEFEGL